MAYETHSNGSWFDETNLVAYYKLEDANDSSGNGYNLTNTHSVPFVSGKFSNCASFTTGSSQSLYISNNFGILGTTATISIWYNPSTAPANGVYYSLVVQNENTNKTYNIIYYYTSGTSNIILFQRGRYNNASTEAPFQTALTIGNWYNLVYVYDGTNLNGYINGKLVAGPAAASGAGSGVATDNFVIGTNTVPGSQFINGKIDETLVFTRAWTAGEVAKYYENSKGQFYGQAAF